MKMHLTRRETLKLLAAGAAGLMMPAVPVFGAMRKSVEYRRLGRTNLQVSVVGFGSLSIGLASTEQQRVGQLLNQALDRGLNIIDTAECYGHPDKNHAEILIGNAIGSRRDEYVLSSKVGHENGHFGQGSDWSSASIHRTIDRSLKRLKTDHLDIVHLHGCSVEILRAGEVIEALKKARQVGKTRFLAYAGSGERVRYAIESNEFDVVQLTLNVFEQNAIDDLLPLAQKRDIGVIAKRPIGNAVWRFPERPEWEWYAEYWDLIKPLDYPFFKGDALADPGPEGAAGMALRFLTSTPGVHTAIVGTTNPGRWTQNNDNVTAGLLSAEQYGAIRANWRALAGEKRELG
ncbi:MAG: aldo/keto reductase [Gammaproteobacteria bacterium]|nr:aldo/keto reductase [Gammaproteobacteria bacterium]